MSDVYVLGHTEQEYERLSAQSRLWEATTARLLARVDIEPGARCLDAGCGPGETTRLIAERVGPGGTVVGLDIEDFGRPSSGPGGGSFIRHDLTADEPVPGAPYDLVFARLLLFHLPQRADVVRRLWDAVAPGGLLVLQDYELRAAGVQPPLAAADEMLRVVLATFGVAGCDVHAGTLLPHLMNQAGAGFPDGTDVGGLLVPIRQGGAVLEGVYSSLLPAAYRHGITTPAEAAATVEELRRDIAGHPERPVLLPLLTGAWKRRPV